MGHRLFFMQLNLLTLIYLIASVTFILGLKMLANPLSARKGNLVAAAGMSIAIFGTIFLYEENTEKLGNYVWIFAGLAIGGLIGTLSAKKVKMTAMPEMVSLFNGMGGACAALISLVEFNHLSYEMQQTGISDGHAGKVLIMVLGLIIGSVSFAGSMIAWGKLNGRVKDFSFPGQNILNLLYRSFYFHNKYLKRNNIRQCFFYYQIFPSFLNSINNFFL